MENTVFKKLFIVTLGLVLVVFNIPRLSADEKSMDSNDTIDMIAGDIQAIPVNSLTRVSVTDPNVADISDAQSDKVSLLAKKAGETILFLWDTGGERIIKVRVVNEELSAVKAHIEKILAEANIPGITLEENLDIGKVVATGSLSKEDKDRMDDILGPLSDSILDLVKVQNNEDLIQIDMQVVEISTTLEKNLGIEWGTTTGSNPGQISLNYNENIPTGDKFKDLFKIGNFQRQTPLQATVNALIQEGKARLISKPRLVVVSGKQASFLVGGEIPVESITTNNTGGIQTQNTTLEQYGVNMTVTPTIREGKIDVLLNVDIRDIDPSQSNSQGTAFITRTAQTDLFMDNKQTIVLAGLIKYTDSEQVTEVPVLSKIPILGALFRNRSTPAPDSNTEMVIILTPTVLTDKKFADNELVMPTPSERNSWNEIDSRYEHAPLPSWPAASAPSSVAKAPDNNDAVSTILPVMTSYARMVQERISKAISYPAAAGNNVQGTVKLKLHILKDGSLDSAEVMESSGNDILDHDAIQAARTAAPYDAFMTGMDQEDVVFTIPIVYNKMISEAQAPEKVVASY